MIARRVQELHESNPMLGHRGCRLGIVYPEITAMQARAIFEAACDVKKRRHRRHAGSDDSAGRLRHRVPQPGEDRPRNGRPRSLPSKASTVDYLVGTMIELPRAAICADQIAKHAEFFSFGTNDLTQTTLGMSRDDYGGVHQRLSRERHRAERSVPDDRSGRRGRLMKHRASPAAERARPDIKLGICGEHGGDPASVMFCHEIGLNYVSCSPFRVPIARLAAAQAAVAEKKAKLT